MLIGLVVAREFIYGVIYFVLLGIMLLGLWIAERWKGIGLRIFWPLGLALILVLFDNVFFVDLTRWLHFRYVFLLLAIFFLWVRPDAWKLMRYFLGLNILYVGIVALTPEKLEPLMVYPDKEAGQVRKQIDQWASEGKNIAVFMLDGYPSERVLKEKFGIKATLRDKFPFLQYRENQTLYLESQISVCHQLFTVRTEKTRNVISNNVDVAKLFADSRRMSTLGKVLQGYEEHWISYLNNKEVYDSKLFLWKVNPLRAFIRLVLRDHLLTSIDLQSMEAYNNWVLKSVSDIKNSGKKPRFVFAYFLTFHNIGYSVEEDMKYAEKYLDQALRALGGDFHIVVFSDHGIRDHGFSEDDQSSGIFYYGEK
jgi:hypothetical protein